MAFFLAALRLVGCLVVAGVVLYTWMKPQLRTLHRHSQTDVVRRERNQLRAELVAARDAYLGRG